MSGTGTGVPDGPDRPHQPRPRPPPRLKARPDFIRAAGGGRLHSRSFSLQVVRRPADGDAATRDDQPRDGRVGLTVTKKVGGAVERNRIKRRLREALRAPDLATMPDHDYVIVARREALTAPFSGLVGELRRCLGDARSGKAKASRPRGAGPRVAPAGPRRGTRDRQPVTHP